jgi:hypothetical protein
MIHRQWGLEKQRKNNSAGHRDNLEAGERLTDCFDHSKMQRASWGCADGV